MLSDAKSVLFVTGAGISAEAGLPTYRGVSGLYNQDDVLIEDIDGQDEPLRMSIEDCLSSRTFQQHPDITWKYLSEIERSCRNVPHSKAHALVAKVEQYVQPGPVTVMTQNIDGLHNRAGSSDIVNIHGELLKLHCANQSCSKYKETFQVPSYAVFETLSENGETQIERPTCTECQRKTVRPNVVLFDEFLGDETVKKYEERLGGVSMSKLAYSWPSMGKPSARRGAPYDVSICIGTSALFPYVNAAALSGCRTIEINPMDSNLSDLVDVHVPGGATEVLEFMFDELGWEL
jgi:NAD-dependent deacetylase